MADATTPSAPDAAAGTTSADTHTCQPRWWPHHIGERWTCDCGHGYHVERAADILATADTCICGQYGWKSDG